MLGIESFGTWFQLFVVWCVVMLILLMITALSILSISMKLTEVMKDVISIDQKNDGDKKEPTETISE